MRFTITGEFVPGASSAGIAPARQTVTLSIGGFSLVIPAGSFKGDHNNDNFRFRGTMNGGSKIHKIHRNYAEDHHEQH